MFQMMENVIDAHYFLLPSQGNVYSLTKLCMTSGNNKILAASLRRKIFSFEYTACPDGFLKPTTREVLFTYIPNGAEIISIDAFNKSQTVDDFVIGITIIKPGGDHTVETYLNIYSEWEPSSSFNLESVAQNCLILQLDFIPYQLYHAYLFGDEIAGTREVVWLLSGSDCKIHMFREDWLNHCYSEVNLGEHFPELESPSSIVMWMDIQHSKDLTRRISVYGCECGLTKVAVVDARKKEVLNTWSLRFEGPISSVRLFLDKPHVKCPDFLNSDEEKTDKNYDDVFHLLITNTLQSSMIYMDVTSTGFEKAYELSGSGDFDAVLCSCIADVDMDGKEEVVLGTYGQEMLVYKFHFNEGNSEWKLLDHHRFPNPIHSIMYMDVTGDGVREFVVLTLRGVHVLQHDPDKIAEKFLQRFNKIRSVCNQQENLENDEKLTEITGKIS